MSKWRLIQSAPRDGTPVLLFLKSKPERNYTVQGLCDRHAIGFWNHQRWCSIEVVDEGSMGGEMTGWMPDYCSIPLDPTHWMPLPKAPRA